MQLTDWAVFIPALTFVGGLLGLVFQRNKTKKEADNFVVTGAAGVVDMYEQMAGRLALEIAAVRSENEILKAQNKLLAKYNHELEAVIRLANLKIPET